MSALSDIEREISELELALLRRGMDQRTAGHECCSGCARSPLIGERVYVYGADRILCALCRARERRAPTASRLVRTAAFGHTLRIIDQRAA
jgi:LSD1 subclass zinc finger protein